MTKNHRDNSHDNSRYFESHDGLKILYKDFGPEQPGTPVICLPGLTRNSRDFEDLAQRLGARRRVLTIDFRGRGYSDYDPDWNNYHPGTYVQDVWTLLDTLEVDRVLVIGTSLGGLCAMRMARGRPERVAGVVLNDVGPEIDPAGLARVKEYTGRQGPVENHAEALRQVKETYGEWLPGLSDADWDRMVWKAYRTGNDGVPRLDFDPGIGRAVREVGEQTGDPWQAFAGLANVPTTLLWGVTSDILTRDIIDRMLAEKPDLDVVEVPNRGHVPLLDEPECLAAIDAMLDRIT